MFVTTNGALIEPRAQHVVFPTPFAVNPGPRLYHHPQQLVYPPTGRKVNRDDISEAVDISGDGLLVAQVGAGMRDHMCINGLRVLGERATVAAT